MNEVTTVGVDLAKQVMHVVGLNQHNRVVLKKRLRRRQFEPWFANFPACVVAMEACSGSHEWARRLREMGHEVRLIPAQFAKPLVRGNKNDYNDALAVAEAARRPNLRPVAIKTREQQDMQALHRMRRLRVGQRTALCNQLRGLLAEYGMVLPRGLASLRRRIPEILEDADNGLSDAFRELLAHSYEQLLALERYIQHDTDRIKQQAHAHEPQRRLQSLPGFGPIVASAFHGVVGDGRGYRRGRDVSAALGLVPAQHATGDKPRMLGISKRGDRYLRALLVHAARSVVRVAAHKDDALSRWIQRLVATRGTNKATVALANKLARMGWALLRHDTVYQPRLAQPVS